MRRSGHWQANNQAREWQEQENLGQDVNTLASGRTVRGRRAGQLIILCVSLCILLLLWVKWESSQPALVPTDIGIRSEGPVQEAVFPLFRYYKRPNFPNTTADPERTRFLSSHHHRRRSRSLHALNNLDNTAQWPLGGGQRTSDLDMEAYYVDVAFGTKDRMKHFFLQVDTGSGVSWVHCKFGKSQSLHLGPNGLYNPISAMYVNCMKYKELCKVFQQGDPSDLPCTEEKKFKCFFTHEYGDGLRVKGAIIETPVTFALQDGSMASTTMAVGCVHKKYDKTTIAPGQETIDTDGLIAIGEHPAAWQNQLKIMGIIADLIIAICIDAAGSSPPAPAGFLSFGNLYDTYTAGKIVWTNMLEPKDKWEDSMYSAKLMAIKYRGGVFPLHEPRKRRKLVGPVGVQMGFDSGSDLSYMTTKVYRQIKDFLEMDAKSMGYVHIKDSKEFDASERRLCWTKPRIYVSSRATQDSIQDFGTLVFQFQSSKKDGSTSDLPIAPENYMTWAKVHKKKSRICLNMLEDNDYEYGNLGVEVMKGYLTIFNNEKKRIGWMPTESCIDIQA